MLRLNTIRRYLHFKREVQGPVSLPVIIICRMRVRKYLYCLVVWCRDLFMLSMHSSHWAILPSPKVIFKEDDLFPTSFPTLGIMVLNQGSGQNHIWNVIFRKWKGTGHGINGFIQISKQNPWHGPHPDLPKEVQPQKGHFGNVL